MNGFGNQKRGFNRGKKKKVGLSPPYRKKKGDNLKNASVGVQVRRDRKERKKKKAGIRSSKKGGGNGFSLAGGKKR